MNEPCSVHRRDGRNFRPQLYRTMRRIRTFEERVGELFVRGQSAGSMLHLSIGEESRRRRRQRHHARRRHAYHTSSRHGIFLARGADPNRMMAEIGRKGRAIAMARAARCIADMGLGSRRHAIVGGGIPPLSAPG